MFFKRGSKSDQGARPAEGQAATLTGDANAAADMALPPPALAVSELRRTVEATTLGFKTTAELEPNTGLIGQDRALEALDFGMHMHAHDLQHLRARPAGVRQAHGDQVADRRSRRKTARRRTIGSTSTISTSRTGRSALRLPPGRARPFAKGMIAALDELRAVVPSRDRGRRLSGPPPRHRSTFQAGQDEALEDARLSKPRRRTSPSCARRRASPSRRCSTATSSSPRASKPCRPKCRPRSGRQMEALEKELAEILEQVPKADKMRRAQLQELNEDVAKRAVLMPPWMISPPPWPTCRMSCATSRRPAPTSCATSRCSRPIQEEDNAPIRSADRDRARSALPPLSRQRHGRANDPASRIVGAPVIEEINPVYGNLIGRIEHIAVRTARW